MLFSLYYFSSRINNLRESGIFDHSQTVTLNPHRISPDHLDKIIVPTHVFENFSYTHLRGIFLLYLVFDSLSFVLLALEMSKLIHKLK